MTRIIALVLAVFAASPSYSQNSATGEDIILASIEALGEGDPVRAAQLAEIILAVKPNNLDALILRSRAALAMEDWDTAQALAKQAYRSTENRNAKFSTARLAAIAHGNAGEDTRGQLWLRRARQFAPDEERAAQVAQEFQLLARRNPWSTSLQFGITPSSNVNGGSTEESLFAPSTGRVFDFSVDARDLPGLEITGGLQSTYRLSVTENAATFLTFGGNFRAIALQQSAVDKENDKRLAVVERAAEAAELALVGINEERAQYAEGEPIPDELFGRFASATTAVNGPANFEEQVVKGRDFSSVSISAGVLHRRILQEGWEPTSFRLDLNRLWYSGDPLSWQYSASVAHTVPLSDELDLTFRISQTGRQVFEFDGNDAYSVKSADGRVGLSYQFANKDRLSVSLNATEADSSNASRDYSQRGIYADYAFGRAFAGMQLGVGLGYNQRDYGFDGIVGLDRADDIYSFNARSQFTEIEYYGFQPVISLNASRTESVNERFDVDTVRIGFDLRSSF